VHRNSDSPRLVGDGSRDRLADPPGRVGRELVAAPVLKFIDRFHQSDVALLDEIQELQAAIRVLLRDRDDEAQVGLDHLLLRLRGLNLAGLDDGHDALDLVGLRVGARLGDLDLLLGDPDLLLLGGGELLGGLQVEIAGYAGYAVGRRVAERDVDEILHLVRRRAPAVGPEPDDALGALDVVEQIAQALHEAATLEVRVFAVDDLIADVERAKLLEHARLPLLGLRLQPLPRRILALARLAPARGLLAELPGLVEELVALAEQPVDHRERRGDLPREVGFLFLGELLLVDVHDFLDRDVVPAKLLAELAEALEGQVGAEDRRGDLVLALLDALGQGDLTLAREERDPAHLAQVEADGILGAPDRSGREIDRLGRAVVVVVVGLRLSLALADLGGEPAGLRRVHHLDVHRAEHHHDVVELVERDEVRREGVIDFVISEEALLLPHRDQSVELLQLWLFAHSSELLGDPEVPCSNDWATPPVIPYTTALSWCSVRNSACIGAVTPVLAWVSAIDWLTSRARRRR
jgi:hypothetical protein